MSRDPYSTTCGSDFVRAGRSSSTSSSRQPHADAPDRSLQTVRPPTLDETGTSPALLVSRGSPVLLAAYPALRVQVIMTNRRVELATGRMVQVLAPWGVPDGLVHLVFTSRRGMLPRVRAVVDFAAEALRAATS